MSNSRLIWTIAAVIACSVVIASQAPSGHATFQQALAKERVDGNLQEAIKLYERVVSEFASDRALAAQALVQVGRCYEKLGRDEAVKAYERLVRDFADQEDAVDVARARLAVLKRPGNGATDAAMPTVRPFPRAENIGLVLALSPDGTKVAGQNYDKGQNLAVYDVASQQTTRLTDFDWTPDSSYVILPAWSPDGKRIAYSQCGNRRPNPVCELRTATLAGDSKVLFRTDAGIYIWPTAWLPDDSAVVVFLSRADKTYSMGLVPTTGGPFTQLRSITLWRGLYPEQLRVSPDGRLIAFVEGSPGDIHVVSRDGRTAHRITDHPAEDYGPLWSPDGRHLVFLSNRGGVSALWAVPIRDGQPVGEPLRVKEGMQDVYPLGWTTRGFVYQQDRPSEDIYTVPIDPASGEPTGSPRMIPYRRTGQNVAPEWSPDGKFLAFVSLLDPDRRVDRRVVVVLPAGGGEPREFPLPNPTRVWGVRWFGDSRGLGFTGFDERAEPTVFRLTLATGEWKTFPLGEPAPQLHRIEWNADGSRYFHPRANLTGEGPAIVEREVASGRERIIFRGNPDDYRYGVLRFSPDRRMLAMIGQSNDGNPGQRSLVVVNIETGQARVVYRAAVGETIPVDTLTWSPGGGALLVRTTTADGKAIQLRRIAIGGEVRPFAVGPELKRLLSPGRGAPTPSMENVSSSPDGNRLAFLVRASQRDTWVLENPLAIGGGEARSRK